MPRKSFLLVQTLLSSLLLLSACSNDQQINSQTAVEQTQQTEFADAIYHNARIYTVNSANPWAEAVAVKSGVIQAIGTAAEVNAFKGGNTTSYDLAGKMMMPGLHDTHTHPVDAGLNKLYQCRFSARDEVAKVLETIRGCVAVAAPGEWIIGGQWSEAHIAGDKSAKAILDEISTEHPLFFMDWSVHNAWVNSKALELIGIDKDTPDPLGGVIVRNEAGEATGVLLDNAAYDAQKVPPPYSTQQYADAITWSIEQMLQHGITTYKDAMVTAESLAAYVDLDKKGLLKTRVKSSLSWKSAWARSHQSEIDTINNRSAHNSEFLDTDFAKIMLDGIPLTYTSALIDPYAPSQKYGDDFRGKLSLPAHELIADVVALDAKGVTVKIHATGDLAARVALDAFEAARKTNGDSGLLHEVSHAETIHPDDIERFSALNVSPEMSPVFWYPTALGDLRPLLGEGRHLFWRMNTLNQSGAMLIYGSDWPVIGSPNPWPGLEAMVTRMDPSGQDSTKGWIEEALDLETAIKVFTLHGAIANKDGDTSGSLEVGKEADFIVLDRNIIEVPIQQVSNTKVLLTVVDGVHHYGQL